MGYATDGQLPRDIYGVPADGVYVPNVGTVAAQGTLAGTDALGQNYGQPIVQMGQAAAVNGMLQNAAAANGNGTPLSLLGMSSIIFTVTMTGFTGTVNFEVTEDGTNYDPLQVTQEGTNLITTSVSGSTTTSVHLYEGSIAGLQNARARVSNYSAGTVTVTAHAIPITDAPRVLNAVLTAGQRATYSAAKVGLQPAASATDIFTISGAAGKVVRVKRIELSATTTSATPAALDILLLKRSTPNSGGTTTGSPTPVAHDINSPATPAATVLAYTANPSSLGTLVGTALRNQKYLMALATWTATDFPQVDHLVWDFGNRPSQEIILRSANDVLAINLNGATPASTASFDIAIEWDEDII
jgi:hypothetical protein